MGAAFCEQLMQRSESGMHLFLFSRKEASLQRLKEKLLCLYMKPPLKNHSIEIQTVDFSNEVGQVQTLKILEHIMPTHIYYFAGGGPHGIYTRKKWSDHMWSFQVTFLFPARLVYWALKKNEIQQLVVIGSSICEIQGEALSASYSAAKHALLGLWQSLDQERNISTASPFSLIPSSPLNPSVPSVPSVSSLDFRLFSPGYMDTDLIPRNASVRQNQALLSPHHVAFQLWTWIQTPTSQRYFVCNPKTLI